MIASEGSFCRLMRSSTLSIQAVALYLYSYYFSGLALGPLVADLDTISRVKVEYGYVLSLDKEKNGLPYLTDYPL